MIRLVWAQSRHRIGRGVALLAALVVAVTSFAVLTGDARSEQVGVVGTVRSNERGAYDLLVRPAGSSSGLEAQQGLISSTAISEIPGGISLAQWQKIEQIPGIYAAAPVAVVGYTMQDVDFSVDISKYLDAAEAPEVVGGAATQVSENGLTRVPEQSDFSYLGDRPLSSSLGGQAPTNNIFETEPDGDAQRICPLPDPSTVAEMPAVTCSTVNPSDDIDPPTPVNPKADGTGDDARYLTYTWQFPMLIEAIDPAQEARLDGLDKAVVSGSYLAAAAAPTAHSGTQEQYYEQDLGLAGANAVPMSWNQVPILVANQTSMQEQFQVQVERLAAAAAAAPATGVDTEALANEWEAASGTPLETVTFSPQSAYQVILNGLAEAASGKIRPAQTAAASEADKSTYAFVSSYLLTSPVTYKQNKDALAAQAMPGGVVYAGTLSAPGTRMQLVGEFDPAKMAGLEQGLGAVPMEPYFPDSATGANAASAKALGGKPLLPNGNVGGLLTVPPSIITTLSALPVFDNPANFANPNQAPLPDPGAPISVIRVKLAGALGTDAASRARLQLAADEIHQRTGLEVDIAAGSSETPVTVLDPAGRYGRPQLALAELWSKQGVATAIVDAIDRKSLILSVLVLVVCALFVAGATSAAVRARRSELAVLACVGWPAWRLFLLLMSEVCGTGLIAGLFGTAAALPLGRLLGTPVGVAHAVLAVPAAVLLAAAAALQPAVQASRAHPGSALAPALASPGRRPARLRGPGRLALTNLRRVPGRALLGAAALAVGVAALVGLVGISASFHGSVSGTVLGDAVVIQVRGSDYAAAVIASILGAATIADVLYVNVRDRAAEYALLHAVGWRDRALARLVLSEAAAMAAAGALVGAACAVGADTAFAGGGLATMILTGAEVVAGAVAVTLLAAAVPALALRRLPAARLLAGNDSAR